MRSTNSLLQSLTASTLRPWILLGPVCFSHSVVQAAPYNLTWTGTVDFIGDPLPPAVASGDSFDFKFKVDNGGASLLSQTWTVSDFLNASINVNSGVYTGTKWSIDASSSSGVFQTDALGNVIAAGSWQDFFTGSTSPFSDSLGNNESNSGLGGYFINGYNEVWIINSPATPAGNFQIEVSASDVSSNLIPGAWSASATVPEPSTLAIALFGVICLGYRERTR